MGATVAPTKSIHRFHAIETPFGVFALVDPGSGRLESRWIDDDSCFGDAVPDDGLWPEVAGLLARYFAGETMVDFSTVPLPEGPPFYRACWRACREIPAGQTRSYAELAEAAGRPGAARAAGQAMRHNPLPVIIPCHRVVASDGRLHGFSGSADPDGPQLALKRWLLQHERAGGR